MLGACDEALDPDDAVLATEPPELDSPELAALLEATALALVSLVVLALSLVLPVAAAPPAIAAVAAIARIAVPRFTLRTKHEPVLRRRGSLL